METEKLAKIIAMHGHVVISSEALIEGLRLPFSYTVGLAEKGRRELVVFGLPTELAGKALNAVALLEGETTESLMMSEGLELRLREAHAGVASEFAKMAVERAGKGVETMQVFWPDEDGFFPWDEEGDPRMKAAQPILSGPTKERLH